MKQAQHHSASVIPYNPLINIYILSYVQQNSGTAVHTHKTHTGEAFLPECVEAVEVLAEPLERQLPAVATKLAPHPRPIPGEARRFLQEPRRFVVKHEVAGAEPV